MPWPETLADTRLLVELTGYVASALVLSTFTMKTMRPLRYTAICSNVAFIVYGAFGALYPVLILHSLLLPLNAYRLWQMRKLMADVSDAARGGLAIDALLPLMTERRHKAGETLFRKGDQADAMYYVARGTVALPELDVRIGPGELVGEIGLFSPDRERTASALCETECDVLSITRQKVLDLCHRDPTFGFHLLHLITGRLVDSVKRLETKPAHAGADQGLAGDAGESWQGAQVAGMRTA